MQTPSAQPSASGFASYVSKRRFRLMLLVCALTLVLMLAVVYGTVGFGPIWGNFAAPTP